MLFKMTVPCSLFLGLVFLGGASRADSLGCNGRITSSGDSKYKVRAVCGDPDEANQRVEVRSVRQRVTVPCPDGSVTGRCTAVAERAVEVVIDEWIYDFGRNRFMQYLTFEQGKLVRVEAGPYGEK